MNRILTIVLCNYKGAVSGFYIEKGEKSGDSR